MLLGTDSYGLSPPVWEKHYENTPMQYAVIFHGYTNDNFQMKNCDVFSYFCSKHGLCVPVRTASVRRF